MKFIILFGLFLVAHGWTSIEKVEMDPNDPNVCVGGKIGNIKVGETKSLSPDQCAEATCAVNSITYTGCGLVSAKPPCQVVPEDLTKAYPQCCETIICP